MKYDKQFFDDVAWERSDIAQEKTEQRFRRPETCLAIKSLIEKLCGKRGTLARKLLKGSFNIIYRMNFEGCDDVLLRIPCPGVIQFPDEKILVEVATMRYVTQNTAIPVPPVQHYRSADENPTGLGPFIIMGYVENEGTLSEAVNNPERQGKDVPPTLDPNAPEDKLEYIYYQMAGYLLQLSQLEFPRIGSLVPTGDGEDSYSVSGRPLSMNMNTMIQLANIPPAVLPPKDETYTTADGWYLALAEMHMAQLVFQHNDLTFSPNDCRNKYVARQLFRRLAKDGKLSTFGFADDDWSSQSPHFCSGSSQGSQLFPAPNRRGAFRLWCDDLRGGNILVDKDLRVAAIIDWEFAYVGPAQFAFDPPWWLLLEEPECWPDGIEEWRKGYDLRLRIWLRAMEKAEEEAEEKEKAEKTKGPTEVEEMTQRTKQMALGERTQVDQELSNGTRQPTRLSAYMRESWETGRFWLNYAARKSWAFDSIYWKYLDERFFGERGNAADHELWKTRLDLLTDEERRGMEPLVERKIEEYNERVLIDWDPEEAKRCLAQVLF